MTQGHARTLMTTPVTSVAPETTLAEIADIFAMERITGAPVVDAELQVIGFVSDSDILNALLLNRGPETTAFTLMSAPVVSVDEFDTTDDVMRVLRESNVHHVPVLRHRRLVGIITPSDVIRHIVTVLPPPDRAG